VDFEDAILHKILTSS